MKTKINKGISESITTLNFCITFKGKQYNIVSVVMCNCEVVIGIKDIVVFTALHDFHINSYHSHILYLINTDCQIINFHYGR